MAENNYSNSHVGEKPVAWPNERIASHPDMWGADEIAQDIEKCRGCSNEHGVCERHRGMMEGYGKAVADMNRAFEIVADSYPEEVLDDE